MITAFYVFCSNYSVYYRIKLQFCPVLFGWLCAKEASLLCPSEDPQGEIKKGESQKQSHWAPNSCNYVKRIVQDSFPPIVDPDVIEIHSNDCLVRQETGASLGAP